MKRKIFAIILVFFPLFAIAVPSNDYYKFHKLHAKVTIPKRHHKKKLKIDANNSGKKTEEVNAAKGDEIHNFTVAGYVDTTFNYLYHSKYFKSGFLNSINNSFDGVSLQQAAVTISKLPKEGLGGIFDFVLGRDAFNLTSYGLNPYFGNPNIGYTFVQIYAQFAHDPWLIMLGKMNALSGYEANNLTLNHNYSRSYIANFAQPGTVTGVRVSYKVNDKILIMAGINDGWDSIRDWSRQKTVELGVVHNVTPKFNYSLSLYSGEERIFPFIATGPAGRRTAMDIITTWNITNKLDFVMNYDYVVQKNILVGDTILNKATWYGVANYLNYEINDKWNASIRCELYYDPDGFTTGIPQNLREVTLSLTYRPFKSLFIRAETRRDLASTNSILKKNNIGTSNNQQSFALEFNYNFEKSC